MRLFFIFCMLLSLSDTVSQTTKELDQDDGSTDYKIGDEFLVLKKREKLKFIKPLEGDETKLYKAKNNLVINGLTGNVELAFYKDRLVEIMIFFERTSVDDLTALKKILVSQYGNPVDQFQNKNRPEYLANFDVFYLWKGNVIGLQLNYDTSGQVAEIVYWGLKETTKEKF
jgi:hypothetical protein